MLQNKRCISDFSRWWFFGHPGIAGCVMGRLSGDGLWQAARDWLCLRAHVFRLEIADSHIIGDLMNLTATGRLYYRGTRSEVTHSYVVAEVFYTSAQIGGTPLPGGRHVANCLIFKLGGK
jgi:hypothetical protein